MCGCCSRQGCNNGRDLEQHYEKEELGLGDVMKVEGGGVYGQRTRKIVK